MDQSYHQQLKPIIFNVGLRTGHHTYPCIQRNKTVAYSKELTIKHDTTHKKYTNLSFMLKNIELTQNVILCILYVFTVK